MTENVYGTVGMAESDEDCRDGEADCDAHEGRGGPHAFTEEVSDC